MHQSSDVVARAAQAKIAKRERFLRDDALARAIPGVVDLEELTRDLFDPRPGFATKSPRARNWYFNNKRRLSASALRRHVEFKESVAIVWGQKARTRVLDADAHDSNEPLDALPALWDAVRALHLGRGRYVGPLVDGKIPHDTNIAGAICKTPRGLQYAELTLCPGQGDSLAQDVERVKRCLWECSVVVRYGQLEVMPNGNGQARLPLGYGCEFVWPPVGKVSTEEGVQIFRGLEPVQRDFPAFDPPASEEDPELCGTAACDNAAAYDLVAPEQPICEFDPNESTFAPETRFTLARKRFQKSRSAKSSGNKWGVTLYEEGSFIRRTPTKSPFVERLEAVLRNGATRGQRNGEMWDLCFMLRLTWGWSREAVEKRVVEWVETAPHTSADLSHLTPAKRRLARRHISRLLTRLDVGLALGKFFQRGARKSIRASGDPLLLVPETPEEISELVGLGTAELQNAEGASMLDGMSAWLRQTLPVLVGGIRKWSRNGRIAMSQRALEAYAHTKKSKRSPSTGVFRSAAAVLRECLEKFGIIGGVATAAVKGKRLAAVYESNVSLPKVVVAAWPKHRNVRRSEEKWKRSAARRVLHNQIVNVDIREPSDVVLSHPYPWWKSWWEGSDSGGLQLKR